MDFGDAIRAMKNGATVSREGWNGKGMWIAISPGNPALKADNLWSKQARSYVELHGGTAVVLPAIIMKNAKGEIVMGWVASQEDMLYEDWVLTN